LFVRFVRAGGALLLKSSWNLANGSARGAEKKMIYEELYETMDSHLKEQNETYLQHLRKAMYYSGCLLVGSACAFVHALVPCVMTETTTKLVRYLSDDLK
jgi:hypothetical protein